MLNIKEVGIRMSTTMSITRALVELKLLNSRICKLVSDEAWMISKTKHKNSNVVEETFAKDVRSSYQSLLDMIERRDKIKAAINASNSTTLVKISGKEMTVAHAIDYKKVVEYKQLFLERLRERRSEVNGEQQLHQMKLQSKIDDNVRVILGRDAKPDSAVLNSITETLTKNDPIEVYDPLKLDELINELDRSIDEFNANIDFVLSESNSLTMISV